jgi:site-specific recombinase XerD
MQRGPITLPYTRDEVSRLLAACQETPDPKRIEALLLALLYADLRISDAVQLERSRLGQDDVTPPTSQTPRTSARLY